MINVLIVDDCKDKAAAIEASLRDQLKDQVAQIKTVSSWHAAREAIEEEPFHLLTLDLLVPDHDGGKPSTNGLAGFLRGLKSARHAGEVRCTIGISEYPDAINSVGSVFEYLNLSVIKFDRSTSHWSDSMKDILRYAGLTARKPDSRRILANRVHATIICALRDPELTELLKLQTKVTKLNIEGDGVTFYYSEYDGGNGFQGLIFCNATRMGMVSTAVIATKACSYFEPRYLLMTGIAAGFSGRVQAGDVVVGDPCWDYGAGKYVLNESELETFSPEPNPYPLDDTVRRIVQEMAFEEELIFNWWRSWPGRKPSSTPKIRIGPIATGAAVIASPKKMQVVEEQQRKSLAVEMEAYAIYAAAAESRTPRPTPIAIKAICDFGDAKKNDEIQSYCAYISACVAMRLIEMLVKFS